MFPFSTVGGIICVVIGLNNLSRVFRYIVDRGFMIASHVRRRRVRPTTDSLSERETSEVPIIGDKSPQGPSSFSLRASLQPEKDGSKLCF